MSHLTCCLLTISDTRSLPEDKSGDILQELLLSENHRLKERLISKDDVFQIRAITSAWIFDPEVQVIITSGGTGFTGRDSTPEAIGPLLDKEITGFGELFRQLSFNEIGTTTIQSRAFAGLANATLIFSLPGSSKAVELGWNHIIKNQLDINFRPCNFAELIPRFKEHQ